MESLLLDESTQGLGLNIVCEAQPKLPVNKKRQRKQNKYERRRAKARKAKALVAEQQSEGEAGASLSGETAEGDHAVQHSQEKVSENEISKKISAEQSQDEEHDDEPEPSQSEPPSRDDGDHPTKSARNPTSVTTPAPRHHAPPITSVSSAGPSRKVHVDTLHDTQERAQYMAQFHARPMEMDRRSGAVSVHQMVASKDSQHIFDTHAPFKSLGLHERIVNALTSPKFNLQRPTLIQTRAIQTLQRSNRCNLFVQSETGSGKTLAYLLPIVQSLAVDENSDNLRVSDRSQGGTRCIVLCPTRELASQTALSATKLCQQSFSWLVPGCLSGGEKRKSEKARIRKGISILVATPGRLLDHLTKTESLLMALKGKLEWLVLDEADRLLDMGLGVQVEQIIQHVRANQPKSGPKSDGVTWRSILVSATVTSKVEDLAKKMLGGDTWLWAKGGDDGAHTSDTGGEPHQQDEAKDSSTDNLLLGDSTPRQLGQFHITVTAKLRLATLVAFLVQRVAKKERTVVFMSTCDGVDYHHALFSETDSILSGDDDVKDAAASGIFGAACQIYKLHGNVPHSERQTILEQFNRGESRRASVLFATDVAARGLNLTGVDWTVQYDPPCEVADYAHRAGRTARAGKAGHSLLFLLPSERPFLDVLKAKGVESITALSLTSTLNQAADICVDFTKDGEKRSGGGYGQSKAGRAGEAFGFEVQRRLEECVVEDDARAKAAAKDVLSQSKQKGSKRKKQKEPVGHLLELARRAYMSYIRSYPTKEKSVKHIFSARALHLGHMARSFALKEAPKSLASKSRSSVDAQGMDDRKRDVSLAFQAQTDEEIAASIIPKRARPDSAMQDKHAARSLDPKKARALLLARASALEQGGMDSL